MCGLAPCPCTIQFVTLPCFCTCLPIALSFPFLFSSVFLILRVSSLKEATSSSLWGVNHLWSVQIDIRAVMVKHVLSTKRPLTERCWMKRGQIGPRHLSWTSFDPVCSVIKPCLKSLHTEKYWRWAAGMLDLFFPQSGGYTPELSQFGFFGFFWGVKLY